MDLHLIPFAFGMYFTCGKCGRVIPSAVSAYRRQRDIRRWIEEVNDWIIFISDDGILYTRCPQHITERTLQVTVGRTNEKRRWAKDAKDRDATRPMNDDWNYMVTPIEVSNGLE